MKCFSQHSPETLKLKRHGRYVKCCLVAIGNLSKKIVGEHRYEDEFKTVELLHLLDTLVLEIKHVVADLLTPDTKTYKRLRDDLEFKSKHVDCEEVNEKYRKLLEENKQLERQLEIGANNAKIIGAEIENLREQNEQFESDVHKYMKIKERLHRDNHELLQKLSETRIGYERKLRERNRQLDDLRGVLNTSKRRHSSYAKLNVILEEKKSLPVENNDQTEETCNNPRDEVTQNDEPSNSIQKQSRKSC